MARRHIMESTFRLNLLNPQHAKINEVIKGLNPKIYKSKEIDAVATALVEAFISNLEGKGDLEKAAATIAQGIKDYSTDKRGR